MFPKKLITIGQLERIPFLYHGFGDAGWKGQDFSRRPEWKNFRLLFLDQVHSEIVHFIRKIPEKNLKGDAMVTDIPEVFLIIKTADCLPILLVDQVNRVIAAVHCGWEGTLKRVLERVVLGMQDNYGSDPQDLLAAFGPCIGSRCYEVGEEMPRNFAARGFPDSLYRPILGRPGKYLFDLQKANRAQLLKLGVPSKNIFAVDICTHCDSRFLSYRRDKGRAGRMLSFIGMSE